MARQIHDELGQAWTGIKMDLSSLLHHPPGSRQQRARRRQSILKLIDEAIESIRKIATELRPGILDDLGLAAAVEWVAQGFASRTGTTCTLDLPAGDLAIEPQTATAGGLFLEVRDNGKGFSEAHLTPGGSLGILGMRERALLLGGQLAIRSSPGDGAAVTVWIPGRERGASD